MALPRVGAVFYFGKDLDLTVVSGSPAKTVHIDPDMSLQIIANSENGPLMKVISPAVFFGRPVRQFSSRLVVTMTFKDLIRLTKRAKSR